MQRNSTFPTHNQGADDWCFLLCVVIKLFLECNQTAYEAVRQTYPERSVKGRSHRGMCVSNLHYCFMLSEWEGVLVYAILFPATQDKCSLVLKTTLLYQAHLYLNSSFPKVLPASFPFTINHTHMHPQSLVTFTLLFIIDDLANTDH